MYGGLFKKAWEEGTLKLRRRGEMEPDVEGGVGGFRTGAGRPGPEEDLTSNK